jgi:hypothetical protein
MARPCRPRFASNKFNIRDPTGIGFDIKTIGMFVAKVGAHLLAHLDPALQARFDAIRRDILTTVRDGATLQTEVREMRADAPMSRLRSADSRQTRRRW